MKKILILSCLFLFFVSSCSNQEEVIVGDGLDYDNMSEEDLRKCAEANGAITWNQFIELMGEFMESEQSPLIETKATSETFSVTGYDNTFLVEENKKVPDYPFMHLLYSQLLVCQRVCLQNTVCLICK